MWSDRVSNPGRLTYESSALPIALPGLATSIAVNGEAFIRQYLIAEILKIILLYWFSDYASYNIRYDSP